LADSYHCLPHHYHLSQHLANEGNANLHKQVTNLVDADKWLGAHKNETTSHKIKTPAASTF